MSAWIRKFRFGNGMMDLRIIIFVGLVIYYNGLRCYFYLGRLIAERKRSFEELMGGGEEKVEIMTDFRYAS